mgnify:CR=1 FL=1
MQTRVLKLKLRRLNRTKEQRLRRLQETFTDCARFHLNRVLALKTTSAIEVHRDCYSKARNLFKLPASTLQQSRDKALAVYRGYLTARRNKRRVSLPSFHKALPLRLAAENIRFFPEKGVARVTTPDGFLWLPAIVPNVHKSAVKLPHGVSEIVQQGRDWYLMLAVKSEDVPTRDGPHFGVDLGLANVAVLAGPGVVRFFDGKPLRYTRGRYFRYRQALQKKRKIGMIKRSKGREARWTTDMNHKVSREIVDVVATAGGVLHVEKLLGIRDRTKCTRKVNRMIHNWPFAQLLNFVHYKAAFAGVRVVEEDPRHTSQQCSRCGPTERANRQTQSRFKCRKCGYEVHADFNAAQNISAGGARSSGAGFVTKPLSGETVGRKIQRGNRNLKSSASGSRLL